MASFGDSDKESSSMALNLSLEHFETEPTDELDTPRQKSKSAAVNNDGVSKDATEVPQGSSRAVGVVFAPNLGFTSSKKD